MEGHRISKGKKPFLADREMRRGYHRQDANDTSREV